MDQSASVGRGDAEHADDEEDIWSDKPAVESTDESRSTPGTSKPGTGPKPGTDYEPV